MKVEFIKAGRADGVQYKKADVDTISDTAAKKLIERGYAKAWKPPVEGKKNATASGE